VATKLFGEPVEERPLFGVPVEEEEEQQPLFGVPVERSPVERPPVKQLEEPENEGVLQELGEGILSGAIGIPEGIAGLVANGIDLMADTNYSTNVKENAKAVRDYLGLDPAGFVGKGAEVITQFVVPGLGVAGAVSKASKLGRLARSGQSLTKGQRFALGAQQVAAATAADIVVATDGVTTIGDFFEGGPTQTNQEIGLEGREEALRQLTNSFKVGLETGALVAATPFALAGAGALISKTGDVAATAAAPVVSPVARAVQESSVVKGTKEFLDDIEATRILAPEQQNFLKNGLADSLALFRYRGFLPQAIGTERSLVSPRGEAEIKIATNTINELNKAIDDVTKGNTELTRKSLLDNLEAFLDPASKGKNTEQARQELLNNLPLNIQPIAAKMRTHIDDLSKDVMDSDLINRMKSITPIKGTTESPGDILSATIEKNLNTYLRRRYLAKIDPNYKPTDEVLKAAIKGFENDSSGTLKYLQELNKRLPNEFTVSRLGLTDDGLALKNNKVSQRQAETAAKEFLEQHRVGAAKAVDDLGRAPIERIRAGMFVDKTRMPDYQRKLLGEIRDPEEAYLSTIADLAEFKATDKFFGKIQELADNNEGIGRLFIAPGQEAPAGFKRLGDEANLTQIDGSLAKSNYGSLEGYMVPERIYKDITRAVQQDHGAMLNTLRSAYVGLIRAKGFTQYGATVLSPITQIRNVTSASLFALAQGNIGRGANLFESVGLVMDDIKKLTPEAQLKELAELQSLGVIGTQAELQEIRRLINKGTAVSSLSEGGQQVGRQFAEKISQSKGGDFLLSAGKKIKGAAGKMEDLYQGGDDIWKIYNFKFEQSKLRNALRQMGDEASTRYAQSKGFDNVDDFIKAEAADIVRNNVPNYNLAPEFIRSLRVLPVGNFIAFPYEILRTGANTVSRSFQELASEVPEIQKIGLRRLMGATTTFGIFPMALSEFAYNLTGVSEDEMKAYQRSLAAPWERNARLIPTGRDENDLPTYINYSYTNPYDMLERFVNGAANKFTETRDLGKDPATAVASAGWEALTELVSPFTEESIAFAALRDVLPLEMGGRGGATVTGAQIYNAEEPLGDRIAKGFTHVTGTILPLAATPLDVRGGELEVGRLTRSFIGATGLDEVTGISAKDRMDRERQLVGELARAFTGVTENTINPELGIKYKGYEFSDARKAASNIFNRIARRPNLTSGDQILNAYVTANESRFNVFNEFHQKIEDYRELGLSDREIKSILKKADVGGIDSLMRGRYEPLEISGPVEEEMRRNGTWSLVPRSELRSIQREQRRREFGEPEEPVTKPSAPAPAPQLFGEPVSNQPIPSTTTPSAPAPQLFGEPVSQTPSQPRNEVSPILVPDPVTRATVGSR